MYKGGRLLGNNCEALKESPLSAIRYFLHLGLQFPLLRDGNSLHELARTPFQCRDEASLNHQRSNGVRSFTCWLPLLWGHVVASTTGVVLNSFLTRSNLIHQSIYFHTCCFDHFLLAPKVQTPSWVWFRCYTH